MNKKFYSIFMLSIVIAFMSINSSCASFPGFGLSATNRVSQMIPRKPIVLASPAYTVVGPVTLEKKWFGILGLSFVPNFIELYLFQHGGVTYTDLLNEAIKLYGDVDAVIDINIGFSGSHYFVFYAERKSILTGIAIKYTREEVGNYSSE